MISTMSGPSRYPGFHKHVNMAFLVIICILGTILPILSIIIKTPSIKNTIVIIVFLIVSYIVYWLIVRLNCYGAPLTRGNSTSSNNNRNNTNTNGIYTQAPRSNNSTTSTHSSTNNQHPTFDSYRFGGFAEIINRLGSSNSTSTTNDDEISCEIGEVLSPPPPTYNTALEGAGLPPPYMNDHPIEVTVHNLESPQMSERYVPPRRPVPSVPSSSSLRRPVPQVPPPQQQQQSSTQSTQYTSQDPSIISDSSPRRPVPSIPQSSGRPVRPVPSVPTSPSTSTDSITR